jgi:hypothetical protein
MQIDIPSIESLAWVVHAAHHFSNDGPSSGGRTAAGRAAISLGNDPANLLEARHFKYLIGIKEI